MIFLIVSALVQGITEVFPVSSSAHLILLSRLWGTSVHSTWMVALHVGTLISFVLANFSRVTELWKGSFQLLRLKDTPFSRNALFTAIATIPAVLVGTFFHLIHYTPEQNPNTIVLCGVGFGFLLYIADQWAKVRPVFIEKMEKGFLGRGLLIGAAQACAFFPGSSRLGLCLMACRLLGYRRRESLEISITLGMVTVFASIVLKAPSLIAMPAQELWTAILVSGAVSFPLLNIFLAKAPSLSYHWFLVYRILFTVFFFLTCFY